MGTGKVLATIVIFSIAAMMVFSILPAYAEHSESHNGACKGPAWDPVLLFPESPTVQKDKDRNNNGWICSKQGGPNGFMFKDDNPCRTCTR